MLTSRSAAGRSRLRTSGFVAIGLAMSVVVMSVVVATGNRRPTTRATRAGGAGHGNPLMRCRTETSNSFDSTKPDCGGYAVDKQLGYPLKQVPAITPTF